MNPSWLTYGALVVAVVLEVLGTTCLQHSRQFTRPLPTALMALCYAGAFYFMSLTLKALPVGITYALWSGLGIILISAVGYFVFHQRLDTPALTGIGFILFGVVIVNVFSKSVSH